MVLLTVIGFALGASLASFLGVVYDRWNSGESILGRSRCACGRQLRWWENVPVVGWLRIQGTAKCCGAKLPVWMFITEVAAGLVVGSTVYLSLL